MNLKAQVTQLMNQLATEIPLLTCIGSLVAAAIVTTVMLGRFSVYDLYPESSHWGWVAILPLALFFAWMVVRQSARNNRKL